MKIQINYPHSVYRGVQICRRGTCFVFLDKQGNEHVRNTAKKGGTLTALKGDIEYYLSKGWV
jgi:hypothetical protein